MAEKILGFKKKDIEFIIGYYGHQNFRIYESKLLVPVVSLEWLEDYCKGGEWENIISIKDLISAARKEAKRGDDKNE